MSDLLPRTTGTLRALAERHAQGTETERSCAGILYVLLYAIREGRVAELDAHLAPLSWQWIDAERAKRGEMKGEVAS
jgi:hypothetical protein